VESNNNDQKTDNTIETLGPYKTDSTGARGIIYKPDKVGTYYLQAHFPAQWNNWTEVAPHVVAPHVVVYDPKLYKASDSEVLALVVTQEPVKYHPGFPLPTEFWTRPIDSQLREWSTVAGNWLTTPLNKFAPYNDAPETPHILWAKPLEMGGLVGGDAGDQGFGIGDAYEGKFQSPVIIGGVLYYNRFTQFSMGGSFWNGIIAVDLRTGEELWFRNNTRLSFGQTLIFRSFNYMGTFAYLWETIGNTWNAYDATTGQWVFTIKDVPRGIQCYGPNGEILIYTINPQEGWMTLWNSSRIIYANVTDRFWYGSWAMTLYWSGLAYNRVFPASLGIEWNKTIPKLTGTPVVTFPLERIIGWNVPSPPFGPGGLPYDIVVWGY
jgi:hypothetical protein